MKKNEIIIPKNNFVVNGLTWEVFNPHRTQEHITCYSFQTHIKNSSFIVGISKETHNQKEFYFYGLIKISNREDSFAIDRTHYILKSKTVTDACIELTNIFKNKVLVWLQEINS